MHKGGGIVEREREEDDRTAYAWITPGVGIVVTDGKRRVSGQGLMPAKERKR